MKLITEGLRIKFFIAEISVFQGFTVYKIWSFSRDKDSYHEIFFLSYASIV